MKQLILLLLVIQPFVIFAQEKVTISGYVEETSTNERLIGASVLVDESIGVATNKYGFYSITLPKGNYQFACSYVGHKKVIKQINLIADTAINFQLEIGLKLKEVEVRANRLNKANKHLSSLSFLSPSMEELDQMPAVFGERDVLKTLQFYPGVKSARENSAGFNVRGGSSDQNLILLDGVPVYNVNHLFGFFSVFNSDAIKNVSFYKGGIPARYGGRLSSVLDITMKEGSMKKPHGVFSISPISGRFTYEAPIKKDTAAFIVSLRRTMLDIPMLLYQTIAKQENKYGYYFYDFNAKTNWIINPKNRVYLSIYSGKDSQYVNGKTNEARNKYRYNWGNITSVLRWNNNISPKLFSNVSAYYSTYKLKKLARSKSKEKDVVFRVDSKMHDLTLKADFDWYFSPHYTLRFGGKVSHMSFLPNIVQMKGNGDDVTLDNNPKNNSINYESFVENDIGVGPFNFNFGLRATAYTTGRKTYNYLEPRAAIRFQTYSGFSANVSYTKMNQFIHLLSSTSLGMPTDLWVASTNKVKPQQSNQFSIGVEQHLQNYSFGIEAYYKKMNDVIRFKEGAVFLSSQNTKWDENIAVGQGKAYGVEFAAKKLQGKLTGILSYTLAWSERQFSDINKGRWFPHKYDRRHDVSLLGEYNIFENEHSKRALTFGFTLQSGNNISMPDLEYEGMHLPLENESTRGVRNWQRFRQSYDNPNNLKMPIFHHLDLGYNTVRKMRSGKSYTWSFSVYNVYNRMNPWYYYKNKRGELKQVSIFPIIPSIGFKYTF